MKDDSSAKENESKKPWSRHLAKIDKFFRNRLSPQD